MIETYLELIYIAKSCSGLDKVCKTADVCAYGKCQAGDVERAIEKLVNWVWHFIKDEDLFVEDMADSARTSRTCFWSRGYLEEQILKDLREFGAFVLKFESGQGFSVVKKSI